MKLETLMLHSLFVACLTVCALIMGAMLHATPPGQIAASTPLYPSSQVSALLQPPTRCALPADGLICPIQTG